MTNQAVAGMTGNSTTSFKVLNSDFENSIRNSFAEQGLMRHLGATMRTVEPGHCIIDLPFSENLTQQDKFFHAGATSTIADSAGGYAAFTLMPANSRVLTVEFKINLIAPATGDSLSADGRVIKPGRTLTVATIEVYANSGSQQKLCAIMQQTTICLRQ